MRLALRLPLRSATRPPVAPARLPLALAATAAAGAVGVRLLAPAVPPAPDPVDPTEVFDPGQLAKAKAFGRRRRRLGLASTVVDAAVSGGLLWALRPGGAAERRFPGGPVPEAAAASVALGFGSAAAGLPLAVASRRANMEVGLVTDTWKAWAGDLAKAQLVAAPIAAGGGALLVAGMRRFGDRWWLPGAAGGVGAAVLGVLIAPSLLDPIFNTFTPAEDPLRSRVLELAEQAGIEVDRVLVVDASRRTTAANAYVTGLGPTKRVVLFDTLLRDFTQAEVEFVVAHELAHVRHRDVPRAIAFLSIAALPATAAVAELMRRIGGGPDARAIPAVSLAMGAVAPVIAALSNVLSRAAEVRADAFAIGLTGDRQTPVDFHRAIVVKNVGDPDPPRWAQLLYGSHPTTVERIARARAA